MLQNKSFSKMFFPSGMKEISVKWTLRREVKWTKIITSKHSAQTAIIKPNWHLSASTLRLSRLSLHVTASYSDECLFLSRFEAKCKWLESAQVIVSILVPILQKS